MTEREPFRVRIKVRHYELDTLGHLNQAVYHSYGEVARTEFMAHAGGLEVSMSEHRLGFVLLASHINYRREIRGGEEVDVTCSLKFGTGKTFQMDSNIYLSDGTLSAEISATVGLMDLDRRKLVADPRGRFQELGADVKALTGEA